MDSLIIVAEPTSFVAINRQQHRYFVRDKALGSNRFWFCLTHRRWRSKGAWRQVYPMVAKKTPEQEVFAVFSAVGP